MSRASSTSSQSPGRVLRLRGLPFSVNDAEIFKFFSDWNVEAVRLCMRQGKPTGEAWVRFDCDLACSEALQRKNKQLLGSRYIELFRAKDQHLETVPSEAVHCNRTGGIVRMRGLPFSASAREVIEFFRGNTHLDASRIFFGYDGTGRPSGEAYITFTSNEGFNSAMKLHKNKMGSRYIELFASSASELHRIAKQRKLRMDKKDGGSRVLVAPKDVDVRPVSSRTSRNRAHPQSAAVGKAVPTAPQQPKPVPRPLVHSFASVAAATPVAALHVTTKTPDEDAKPAAALTQHIESMSMYQQDSRDFVQSYQGQISGAASGTSSAGTAGGHRASRGEAGNADQPSSDSPVWDMHEAGVGWYNMWADHPMLPNLGLYESPSESNLGGNLNVWEAHEHSGHVFASSMQGL